MINYDRGKPLIILHIPKTAGTSMLQIYRSWFGSNLHLHYPDTPEKLDLDELHTEETPVAVCGHFNANRGLGVQDYYPEAQQFVTFVRDPWELMVSGYFYAKSVKLAEKHSLIRPLEGLEEFMMRDDLSPLHFFPEPMTRENY